MSADDLKNKYMDKLKEELGDNPQPTPTVMNREYKQFRKEILPNHLSRYEYFANLSEKILNIKPDEKEAKDLRESINTCHLNATPAGLKSVAILAPLALVLAGLVLSVIIPPIIGIDIGTFGIFVSMIAGAAVYGLMNKLPSFLANNWRLKASNEMVLSVFYVVTYMRHTSNLENALIFASDHLTGPLALDMRKVIWDVETEKFNTIKESMDDYLEFWKKWNNEFVEAMHLIESSLAESSEDRRINLLDKSLDVILEQTYEKMLHYAHNLHSPVTTLHMLGVILPILGLVMLPLLASFMTSEDLPPNKLAIYIAFFYNIALPLIVYYYGKNILASRPTGYGDTDMSSGKYDKYKKVNFKLGGQNISLSPVVLATIIGIIGLMLSLFPIFMHAVTDIDIVNLQEEGIKVMHYDDEKYDQATFQFLGYKKPSSGNSDEYIGPYGLGAAIFSLFLPLTIGVSLGLYFRLKSRKLMKIREDSKKIESQFGSSLFQLGNRLGDGLPGEIAITKVAQVMKGTVTGNFFNIATTNVRRLGMTIKQAIFDPKVGAIKNYPSNLIKSSMKVLVESIKKGPQVAAQALLNIARYVKEIHRVNERLKDLMGDIIGSMKSQISFMTPAISGIVIGITSMVTYILSRLKSQMSQLTSGEGAAGGGGGMGGMEGLLNIFGDGIPTYYSQIIVGIYVIQITYLLTVISNSIEHGSDKLNEEHELGKNLVKSTALYIAISLLVMIIFNAIASTIIGEMLKN
ncbi:MAG: hypothetical protein ACQEP1_00285 [Nanobdellota archaeon]